MPSASDPLDDAQTLIMRWMRELPEHGEGTGHLAWRRNVPSPWEFLREYFDTGRNYPHPYYPAVDPSQNLPLFAHSDANDLGMTRDINAANRELAGDRLTPEDIAYMTKQLQEDKLTSPNWFDATKARNFARDMARSAGSRVNAGPIGPWDAFPGGIDGMLRFFEKYGNKETAQMSSYLLDWLDNSSSSSSARENY